MTYLSERRENAMSVWDDLLTEEERKVYEVFRQPKALGNGRPFW